VYKGRGSDLCPTEVPNQLTEPTEEKKMNEVVLEYITPEKAMEYLATEKKSIVSFFAQFFQKSVVFQDGVLIEGARNLRKIVNSRCGQYLHIVRHSNVQKVEAPAAPPQEQKVEAPAAPPQEQKVEAPAETISINIFIAHEQSKGSSKEEQTFPDAPFHGKAPNRKMKREAAISAIKRHPERSDNWIATDLGIDQETVTSISEELVANGEISPRPDMRIGADGRKQPAKKKMLAKVQDQPISLQVKDIESLMTAATQIKFGMGFRSVWTLDQKQSAYKVHREAAAFLQPMMSRHDSGFSGLSICTPIGRAWYTQDRSKLAELMFILMNGESTGTIKDIPSSMIEEVIRFRKYLLTKKDKIQSAELKEKHYLFTQSMIWAFVSGHAITHKLVADRELFPVPGDQKYPTFTPPVLKGVSYDKGGTNSVLEEYILEHDRKQARKMDPIRMNQDQVRVFASLWWDAFGDKPTSVSDLVRLADKHKVFPYLDKHISKKPNTRSIWLSKFALTPLEGVENGSELFYWLCANRKHSQWKLQKRTSETTTFPVNESTAKARKGVDRAKLMAIIDRMKIAHYTLQETRKALTVDSKENQEVDIMLEVGYYGCSALKKAVIEKSISLYSACEISNVEDPLEQDSIVRSFLGKG